MKWNKSWGQQGPEDPRDLFFIGLPGSGKTRIGMGVAKRLGRPFLDPDVTMVKAHGATCLREVVEAHPKDFLVVESTTILTLIVDLRCPFVISPGGSVIYEPAADVLARRSRTIYLDASPDTIKEKVLAHRDRGVVVPPGMTLEEYLEVMNEERGPICRKLANMIVNTDGDRDLIIEKLTVRLAQDGFANCY
jgi:shikimate kinase